MGFVLPFLLPEVPSLTWLLYRPRMPRAAASSILLYLLRQSCEEAFVLDMS